MDILNNENLLISKIFMPFEGALRAFFTCSLGFSLRDGKIIAPNEIWQVASDSLGEDGVIDLGMPKPQAEWLMAGCASAPYGTTVDGLKVQVQVGAMNRTFLVRGDCEDTGTNLIQPREFSLMPLSFKNTYGGENYKENIYGKGHGNAQLPNILELNSTIAKPASPYPINILNKNISNLGSFNNDWLKNSWPGLPFDFDFSYYNQAQIEQRQNSYFVGNEAIYITNMNSHDASINSRLPKLKLRAFFENNSEQAWHEVNCHLDTLWLFPNAMSAMLLWHFNLVVDDEQASNIDKLCLSLEDMDKPQSAEFLIASALQSSEITEAEEAPQIEEELEEQEELAQKELEAQELKMPIASIAPEVISAQAMPEFQHSMQDIAGKDLSQELDKIDLTSSEVMAEADEIIEIANQELAKQGLPPLNKQDVYAEMQKTEKMLNDLLAESAENKTPELQDVLKSAGLGEEQIKNLELAMDLEIPLEDNFLNKEMFELAVDEYFEKISALTGADSSSMSTMAAIMKGNLPEIPKPSPAELFIESGFSPSQAENMVKALDLPILEGDVGAIKYLEEFGKVSGIPIDGSSYISFLANLKTTMYTMPETTNFISGLKVSYPHYSDNIDKLLQATQNVPQDKLFDLKQLAQDSGIADSEILSLIEEHDPIPIVMPDENNDKPKQIAEEQILENIVNEDNIEENLESEQTLENEPFEINDKNTFLFALQNKMDLNGHDFSNFDLSGLNLQDADLSGLILEGVDFSNCNLSGVNFSMAYLVGANFSLANLSSANLNNANVQEANFYKAIMKSITASEVDFNKANFSQTNLSFTSLHACSFEETIFSDVNFQHTNFTENKFDNTNLIDIDFSSNTLSFSEFSNCKISNCNFYDATMMQVTFDTCNLDSNKFLQAKLDFSRFYNSEINSDFSLACMQNTSFDKVSGTSNFTRANLNDSSFERCTLSYSIFNCVHARKTLFLNCDLHGADLFRIDLLDGSLRGCKLGSANLSQANLFAADLYLISISNETNLFGANLENTCLNLSPIN